MAMSKQKKEKMMNGFEFDLPEELIQHIQSFMDGKQAARTSLLSKSWYNAWFTRPVLDFHVKLRLSKDQDAEIRNYIRRCMNRYKQSNQNLQKFVFRFSSVNGNVCTWWEHEYANLFNALVADASILGLNEIDYDCSSAFTFPVPATVFDVRKLTKLSIRRCNIDKLQIDSTSARVRSSPLVSLRLDGVCFSWNNLIRDIFVQCPLIENLDVNDFTGVLHMNLSNLRNLVCLRVCPRDPGSSTLSIDNGGRLVEFNKLRVVCLKSVRIEGGFFINFSSRFPCIENLSLDQCTGYDKAIHISSRSLKYLTLLEGNMNVEEANFNVPNIRKFGFKTSGDVPALSFRTVSTEWESKVEFSCSRETKGSATFVRLTEFLKELNLSRTILHLDLHQWSISRINITPRVPQLALENVVLSYDQLQAESALCFLSDRCLAPKFITLVWDFYRLSSGIIRFVQHLHRVLRHQKFELQIFEEMEWRTIKTRNFVQHPLIIPEFILNENVMIRFQVEWGAQSVP